MRCNFDGWEVTPVKVEPWKRSHVPVGWLGGETHLHVPHGRQDRSTVIMATLRKLSKEILVGILES